MQHLNGLFAIIRKYQHLILLIFIPLAFAALPIAVDSKVFFYTLINLLQLDLDDLFLSTKASKCGYVTILMASFWITKLLPIGLTSLMPVLLFPLFGVMSADKVARGYFKVILN